MSLYNKLESVIENTNNIDLLKDMLIETIANNDVNLNALYNDHKKQIDTEFIKDKY